MIPNTRTLLIISAVLLILAFPPFPTGIVAWVALIPLFFFLIHRGLKEAWIGGLFFGLIWTAGTVYWIALPTVLGLLGTLIIVPLYSGLFALVMAWLLRTWGKRVLWTAPVVWTGLEILSSWGPFAFPWNLLGYTQTFRLEPLQMASVTGVFGLSFWVVLINVLGFFLYVSFGEKKRRFRLAAALALVIGIPWIHGTLALRATDATDPGARISLAQGNVDPQRRWTPAFIDSNFTTYYRLTFQAIAFQPDLMIWPETAATCYLAHKPSYLRPVREWVDTLDAPLLTGSPDYRWVDRETAQRYNSALLLRPNRWKIERYIKVNLVPFSERVPFVDQLPFLLSVGDYFKLGMGNFTPGDSGVVFDLVSREGGTEAPFSPLICYDSVFPYFVADCVRQGATFLALITNDGWFGKTSGPYQHAKIAVVRAIENRRWIARCANTGISACIDPHGRIHGSTRLNQEALLNCRVGVTRSLSFFTRHGRWVLWINQAVLLGLLLATGWMAFRNKSKRDVINP